MKYSNWKICRVFWFLCHHISIISSRKRLLFINVKDMPRADWEKFTVMVCYLIMFTSNRERERKRESKNFKNIYITKNTIGNMGWEIGISIWPNFNHKFETKEKKWNVMKDKSFFLHHRSWISKKTLPCAPFLYVIYKKVRLINLEELKWYLSWFLHVSLNFSEKTLYLKI